MIGDYIFLLPFLIHVIYVYIYLKNLKFHTKNKKPLKDIIMDNCFDLRNFKFINEPLILIFLIPYIVNKKLKYLYNVIKIFSLIFSLRIITSTITEMPSSDPNCDINKKGILKYITGHCFDKIFSGHTSLTLILVLVAFDKNLVNYNQYIIYQILQILYGFLLICTKCHYSVDVILSYIIVIPIFLLIKNK